MPSRFTFGLALANEAKIPPELPRFNGAEVLGASESLGVGFSFLIVPFPKKSLPGLLDAREDCASCFGFEELGALVSSLRELVFAFKVGGGVAAAMGGGRRPVRLLTPLLMIVPYVDAVSRGSWAVCFSSISLLVSDKVCMSFMGVGPRLYTCMEVTDS